MHINVLGPHCQKVLICAFDHLMNETRRLLRLKLRWSQEEKTSHKQAEHSAAWERLTCPGITVLRVFIPNSLIVFISSFQMFPRRRSITLLTFIYKKDILQVSFTHNQSVRASTCRPRAPRDRMASLIFIWDYLIAFDFESYIWIVFHGFAVTITEKQTGLFLASWCRGNANQFPLTFVLQII